MRVVLDGLVDDLLLLSLLLCTNLVLQPKNAGLRSKLLLAQRAQLPSHLTGKSESSLLASDPLESSLCALDTLSSALQSDTCALQPKLAGVDGLANTLESKPRTLHSGLQTLNVLSTTS